MLICDYFLEKDEISLYATKLCYLGNSRFSVTLLDTEMASDWGKASSGQKHPRSNPNTAGMLRCHSYQAQE